jgi:hypothetical protein
MGDVTGTETLNVVCDNCGLPESRHVKYIGTRVQQVEYSHGNGHYICDGYSQKRLLTAEKYAKLHK